MIEAKRSASSAANFTRSLNAALVRQEATSPEKPSWAPVRCEQHVARTRSPVFPRAKTHQPNQPNDNYLPTYLPLPTTTRLRKEEHLEGQSSNASCCSG